MNFGLLFPFAYFYTTRLRTASPAFHILFEWVAAALVVVVFGAGEPADDLLRAGLCYLAFISLYELGYLANDLLAARKEEGGRRRGPQDAPAGWIAAWAGTRIAAFLACTHALGQWAEPAWWLFFAALAAVFALHNRVQDGEFKLPTFLWLAWLRFMAPVIFVVQADQRMGIGLAAAMGYVAFRQLGYLDSKGLLAMPGRRSPAFRRYFFLVPLAGVAALIPYAEARGFSLLMVYWSAIAVLGTLLGGRSQTA